MYELAARRTDRPKARRDGKLIACVAGGLVMLALLAGPLVFSMRLMYQFHSFTQDLAVSFVNGEDRGLITAASSDEEITLSKAQAERLYKVLMDNGMGHPRAQPPAAEEVVLDFGEGSTLRLRPTEITEKGRKNDTGLWISYTRPDGRPFSYDTDGLQYEDMLRILFG